MERTAEACRAGNLEYVSTMDPGDLQRLIGRADEDGRSLLHAAASSGSVPLVMPSPLTLLQLYTTAGCCSEAGMLRQLNRSPHDHGHATTARRKIHPVHGCLHDAQVEFLLERGAATTVNRQDDEVRDCEGCWLGRLTHRHHAAVTAHQICTPRLT